jgi:hypothetical protein
MLLFKRPRAFRVNGAPALCVWGLCVFVGAILAAWEMLVFPWIASGSAPRVTPARLLAVALFAALH